MSMAEIGTEGRARAALSASNCDSSIPLVPAFSYTNQIWIGRDLVVRCNTGRLPGAFAHEAALLGTLDERVPHAELLGHGDDEAGEWMVLRRVRGLRWTLGWPQLSTARRQALAEDLAHAIVGIQSVPLPPGFAPPWLRQALTTPSLLHEAHHPPVEAIPGLLDRLREVRGLDSDLVAALGERWRQLRSVCRPDDPQVLVHGDLHWNNLIVAEGRLAAVLDWEGARHSRPEHELDIPLRFSAWPWLPVAEEEEPLCEPVHYELIPRWMRDATPELFSADRLIERLELHPLAHDLVQALHFPSDSDDRQRRGTVWWRLAECGQGRTHIRSLLE